MIVEAKGAADPRLLFFDLRTKTVLFVALVNTQAWLVAFWSQACLVVFQTVVPECIA